MSANMFGFAGVEPGPMRLPKILTWVTGLYLVCAMAVVTTVLNLIQAIVFFVPWGPKVTRRQAAQSLAAIFWNAMQGSVEGLSGVPVLFSGDRLPHRRQAIMTGNHQGGLDFLAGVSILARAGMNCANLMTLMKSSLVFVPIVGWTNVLQGSLFLNRNWTTDQRYIDSKAKEMTSGDFPRPWWIGLYPEGTRITKTKLEESQKFARGRGLPVLNHIMLPRAKGFCTLVEKTKSDLEYVVDATIWYDKALLWARDILLKGAYQTKAIRVHIKLTPLTQVPTNDATELEKWLVQAFVAKDQALAHVKEKGFFPGSRYTLPIDKTAIYISTAIYNVAFAMILAVLFGLWPYGIMGLCISLYSPLLYSERFKQADRISQIYLKSTASDIDSLLKEEEAMAAQLDSLIAKASKPKSN
eukprot:TRINITY_DN4049_c0_g1_i1.p1 TRINITY_DN4049_c0_g1~~TRINITY_DN4049_c0_g1_i1.p1  ORF type:complete len:412 (-),score=112.20 TRINITY_DN4049_c0_g1_i1:37-1272(-)